MTSATCLRTGNPVIDSCNAAVSPKVRAMGAMGAIAHSCSARGPESSQCSRRPTAVKAGIRGIVRFANPRRAAHQITDTAMAKAKAAVYPASSHEGYTRHPWLVWGTHSCGSCAWWQFALGGGDPPSTEFPRACNPASNYSDIGFIALLLILTSWADTGFLNGLVKGLPAV